MTLRWQGHPALISGRLPVDVEVGELLALWVPAGQHQGQARVPRPRSAHLHAAALAVALVSGTALAEGAAALVVGEPPVSTAQAFPARTQTVSATGLTDAGPPSLDAPAVSAVVELQASVGRASTAAAVGDRVAAEYEIAKARAQWAALDPALRPVLRSSRTVSRAATTEPSGSGEPTAAETDVRAAADLSGQLDAALVAAGRAAERGRGAALTVQVAAAQRVARQLAEAVVPPVRDG